MIATMKIKSLHLVTLVCALLSISCKDNAESAASDTAKKAELNAIHPGVEFYIQLTSPHTPQSQALGPHMRSKDLANKNSWQLRLNPMQDKTTKYEFNISYTGSTATADNYDAEVIFHSNNPPVKQNYTISYDGTKQVIHSVSNTIACEAGIRPKEKTK